MRFVDLSASVEPSARQTPAFQRTNIKYFSHADGAAEIEQLFGVTPQLLRDGEGWTRETLTLGTHNSTHVDAPWHYNSTIDGDHAQTIDALPLDWFFGPGIVVDFTDRDDGEVISAADIETRARRSAGGALTPGDIVLVRTGRDVHYGRDDYLALGPGVSAEATHWLYEQDVRVMGIDAWGWDRPLHLQAQDAVREGRTGIFWEAHQTGLAYSQIERLVNLGELPLRGFMLACFPLRVVGASAAPAWVVAMLDEAT